MFVYHLHQLDRNCLANTRAKGCKDSGDHEAREIICLRSANDPNNELGGIRGYTEWKLASETYKQHRS